MALAPGYGETPLDGNGRASRPTTVEASAGGIGWT